MADWFGKSIWALAFAATVAAMPVESIAADSGIKLPEAVVAQCRADAMAALAGLKVKVEANPSPQATTLLENAFRRRVDGCLETAGFQTNLNNEVVGLTDAKLRLNEATAGLTDAKLRLNEATTHLNNATDVGKNLAEADLQLKKKLEFFRNFVSGRKTKEEYEIEIAALPGLVASTMEKIAFTRRVYANNPTMIASTDRLEEGVKQIAMYIPIRTAAK